MNFSCTISIDLCSSPLDEVLTSSYDSNIGTNKVQFFEADDAVTARIITTCQNMKYYCHKLQNNVVVSHYWINLHLLLHRGF